MHPDDQHPQTKYSVFPFQNPAIKTSSLQTVFFASSISSPSKVAFSVLAVNGAVWECLVLTGATTKDR